MEPRPIDRSADDGARDRMIARELLDAARTALGDLPTVGDSVADCAAWSDAAANVAYGYTFLAGLAGPDAEDPTPPEPVETADMTARYDAELDALTALLAPIVGNAGGRQFANRLMAAGVRVALPDGPSPDVVDETVHDAAFDIATAVRRGARSDLIETATNRLGSRLDEGWIWPENLDPHRIAREAAANVVDAVHAAAVTYLDGLAGRAPGEADAMPPGPHCVYCHHPLTRRADGVWLDDVDTTPAFCASNMAGDGLHHLPGAQVQEQPNRAAARHADLLADLLAEAAGHIADLDDPSVGTRHNWSLDLIGRLTHAAGELRHPTPNPDAPRVVKVRDLADVVMSEARHVVKVGDAVGPPALTVIVAPGRYAREVADILGVAHNRGAFAGTAGAGLLVIPRDLVEGDEQDTPAPFGKVPVPRPPFAQVLANAAGMLDHQGPPIPAVVVDAMVDQLRAVAAEAHEPLHQRDGQGLDRLLLDAADALAGADIGSALRHRYDGDLDNLAARLRQTADDCTMRPAPSPEPAADDHTWHVRAWHVVDAGLLGALVVCPVCGGDDLGRQAGCDECSGAGTLHMGYRTPAGGLIDVHAHPDALTVFDRPTTDEPPPEPEVTAEQDVTTPAHWVDGDTSSCRFCEDTIVLTHRGWVQRWGPATTCPNAPDDAPGDGHLPLTDRPGQHADVQWSTCARCHSDIRVVSYPDNDAMGPMWSTAAAAVAELAEAADEYVLCPAHPDPPGFHTVTGGPS